MVIEQVGREQRAISRKKQNAASREQLTEKGRMQLAEKENKKPYGVLLLYSCQLLTDQLIATN